MIQHVPVDRIRRLTNHRPAETSYVLYWMTSSRRLFSNFALERALEHARHLHLPLLIFEPLRADYPHACARFHRFVLDGMVDNQRTAAAAGVTYLAYVEPEAGAGKGLLRALSAHAAVIVTDDAPWFHYPAMLRAAARQVLCPLEAVDGDGLMPMRSAPRDFKRAHDFRRFLQRQLPDALRHRPVRRPLDASLPGGAAVVPEAVRVRWPQASGAMLRGDAGTLERLPIDHTVGPTGLTGGHTAAVGRLEAFVESGLHDYADTRNHPDHDSSSRLSAWLHFGHLGADEVFDAVTRPLGWTLDAVSDRADGRRQGWWGLPPSPEAFVDQLVTWRELGRNFCANRDDITSYDSLPEWALATLDQHAADPREHQYTLAQLECAQTADPLWNAAQNQLRREGRIHNYLRMLWGKRILEWSDTPREAARRMILLNDRYALDGRDPNSYSGIFWVLGRYDRAWGPERPIFGKIRYMSSANTRRKLRLNRYLDTF